MSKKEIKPELITLNGFEIVYSDAIFYDKDKKNVLVTVDLNIDGKIFSRKESMWLFEVSNYLSQFGVEL